LVTRNESFAPAFATTDHQATDVGVVAECHGLKLSRTFEIDHRGRGKLENRLHQRFQILGFLRHVSGRKTRLRRGVDGREIELIVVGSKFDQKIEDLVENLFGALLGPIDLVDHQDRFQPMLQGLAQHEARLGHHTFDCVHQQKHRVHHAEYALDLPTEVCVAGGIDELDRGAFELDRSRLRRDRDAAFPLEIVRVHYAFDDDLVLAKRTGKSQHGIDEGRLAVIDVGDDGEVSQIVSGSGV